MSTALIPPTRVRNKSPGGNEQQYRSQLRGGGGGTKNALGLLKCDECTSIYVEAELVRSMPCQHAFCSECLKKLAAQQGGRYYPCPLCWAPRISKEMMSRGSSSEEGRKQQRQRPSSSLKKKKPKKLYPQSILRKGNGEGAAAAAPRGILTYSGSEGSGSGSARKRLAHTSTAVAPAPTPTPPAASRMPPRVNVDELESIVSVDAEAKAAATKLKNGVKRSSSSSSSLSSSSSSSSGSDSSSSSNSSIDAAEKAQVRTTSVGSLGSTPQNNRNKENNKASPTAFVSPRGVPLDPTIEGMDESNNSSSRLSSTSTSSDDGQVESTRSVVMEQVDLATHIPRLLKMALREAVRDASTMPDLVALYLDNLLLSTATNDADAKNEDPVKPHLIRAVLSKDWSLTHGLIKLHADDAAKHQREELAAAAAAVAAAPPPRTGPSRRISWSSSSGSNLQPHHQYTPTFDYRFLAFFILSKSRKVQSCSAEERRPLGQAIWFAQTKEEVLQCLMDIDFEEVETTIRASTLIGRDIRHGRYDRLLLPDRFDCEDDEMSLRLRPAGSSDAAGGSADAFGSSAASSEYIAKDDHNGCVLCFDAYDKSTPWKCLLPCRHVFCAECLVGWETLHTDHREIVGYYPCPCPICLTPTVSTVPYYKKHNSGGDDNDDHAVPLPTEIGVKFSSSSASAAGVDDDVSELGKSVEGAFDAREPSPVGQLGIIPIRKKVDSTPSGAEADAKIRVSQRADIDVPTIPDITPTPLASKAKGTVIIVPTQPEVTAQPQSLPLASTSATATITEAVVTQEMSEPALIKAPSKPVTKPKRRSSSTRLTAAKVDEKNLPVAQRVNVTTATVHPAKADVVTQSNKKKIVAAQRATATVEPAKADLVTQSNQKNAVVAPRSKGIERRSSGGAGTTKKSDVQSAKAVTKPATKPSTKPTAVRRSFGGNKVENRPVSNGNNRKAQERGRAFVQSAPRSTPGKQHALKDDDGGSDSSYSA